MFFSGLAEGFDMRYKGHRNCDTVKQVTFLGSQSEMVNARVFIIFLISCFLQLF